MVRSNQTGLKKNEHETTLQKIGATGTGVAIVMEQYARHLAESLEEKTVAIQGFSNVGYYAAKTLHGYGAKIIAVSDSKGGEQSDFFYR